MSQVKIVELVNGVILKLKGQFIGVDETDELRRTLHDLSDQRKSNLIIDLANVTYLNSTALGVLISAHTNFVKSEGKLVLCNISESIKNIFIITKLTLVFIISETLEDAINLITE